MKDEEAYNSAFEELKEAQAEFFTEIDQMIRNGDYLTAGVLLSEYAKTIHESAVELVKKGLILKTLEDLK